MKKLNYAMTILMVNFVSVGVLLPSSDAMDNSRPMVSELTSSFLSSSSLGGGNLSFGSKDSELTVSEPTSPFMRFKQAVSNSFSRRLSPNKPLSPWQKKLIDQIKSEQPGFSWAVLDATSMEIVGTFMVGEKSWQVLEVDGKVIKPCSGVSPLIGEKAVPWKSSFKVSVQPQGVYSIITFLSVPHYFSIMNPDLLNHVSTTESGSKQYIINDLENFFSSEIVKRSNPCHSMYSE